MLEAQGFLPQGRVGAFVFQSQGSRKEGESWAVYEVWSQWAETGKGAERGVGGCWLWTHAPNESKPSTEVKHGLLGPNSLDRGLGSQDKVPGDGYRGE